MFEQTDALDAYRLNKKDGGKVTIQHDTYFPPETLDKTKVGTLQSLSTVAISGNETGQLVAKGTASILVERGINIEGKRAKCKARKDCELREDCCLARILSLHEDFRNKKPALTKLLESRGHRCVFIPKFHCELNPIEMVRHPLLSSPSLTSATTHTHSALA